MGCIRYTVMIDNELVAQHMVIEHALLLVEALFSKFFEEASEVGMTISVKSEARVRDGASD